jgi:D-ribose pyranose/furanose isomerase RbsD
MPKLIPAAERVLLARDLIQKAREFPIPAELGRSDLSYIAGVKDLLRQARDLVKFIPQTAGVSVEMKEDVKKIYEEIETANRDVLGRLG